MVRLLTGPDRVGVLFISLSKLNTSNDNVKDKFYRAFNSTTEKNDRCEYHEVKISLIKAKCLPILLCGTEACHGSDRETTSLEYPI